MELRVSCELTWSRDTVHWERVCEGTPLIPHGPKGSYDYGCIYAAAHPVVLPDEIRLYYGGNNSLHNDWRDGFFCLARLRPDGFAGMQTTGADGRGTVVTRPIPCAGRRLRVSADVKKGGALRVAVLNGEGLTLDQCRPITGSVTDGRVTWEPGADLTALEGRKIQLQFALDSATLYAFSFAD